MIHTAFLVTLLLGCTGGGCTDKTPGVGKITNSAEGPRHSHHTMIHAVLVNGQWQQLMLFIRTP